MPAITFRIVDDEADRGTLDDVFASYWPAYRRWMERANETEVEACRRSLRAHMPELVAPFESLLDRFGGGDDVARFLTLWNPPRVMRACTQLVFDSEQGPVLVRTYDHHPKLFDGIVLRSAWKSPVLALSDCAWGALDGVNGDGLAIALAFGGRDAIGDGFAAPLVCRYVLETCANVAQARRALARLPVYMPYTFVVADRAGDFVTAYLGPDREAVFVGARASANHQGRIEWAAYARFSQSEKRQACARTLLRSASNVDDVLGSFCEPPLWRTAYSEGSGTLYAACYELESSVLTLAWPGSRERVLLADVREKTVRAELPADTGRAARRGA
ncbi:MAG: C45 family peptidase [Planctomycetota bacterium]